MRILTLVGAVVLLTATAASAQSTVKEIRGYRAVNVTFSENADTCNLKDPAMFADHVMKQLDAAGIKRSDNMVTDVNVGISGTAFGTLSTSCALHTELTFSVVLRADNIVTQDPDVRAAIDRLQVIPVIVYKAGRFGTVALSEPAAGGPSTTAQKRVIQDIDHMIGEIAGKRG